jgi:hypothetical protein
MEQLKTQIDLLKREIYRIDNTSVYSLSYYFFNESAKREENVIKIKDLELEIEFLKDDMKREKYRKMRDKDPLKMSKKGLTFS